MIAITRGAFSFPNEMENVMQIFHGIDGSGWRKARAMAMVRARTMAMERSEEISKAIVMAMERSGGRRLLGLWLGLWRRVPGLWLWLWR
jgi:hypothetical protein